MTVNEANSTSLSCGPFAKGDASQGIYTQVIDPTNRLVYWGVDTSSGSVIKMSYCKLALHKL